MYLRFSGVAGQTDSLLMRKTNMGEYGGYMKRIVFVNLHADWMLLETAEVHIFKYSKALKHGYLLKYLLNHPEYEVCNYVNDRAFSLVSGGSERLHGFLNLFAGMEWNAVYRWNGILKERITTIKRIQDIREDDIVILYNVFSSNFRQITDIHAFKALSLLHFFGKDGECKRIKGGRIDCLISEANLSKTSEIFNRYYDLNLPWVIHPFVFAERFVNKTPFADRKNMAFATGTITYKKHPEFLEVYGDACDQPHRKQIKDNPEFFADTIYCTSSDYYEDSALKEVGKDDNKLVRLYKNLHNRFFAGKQKKYYSFDMVEAFNSYKMCIVGEEILGVPGIGFVEGMACGCAYIGIDSPMYTDVGLIPGVHYITYDGTKEDLKRVIEYYQMDEHQAALEQIAKTGCEYVRTHFNGDAVAEKLLHDLEAQQRIWLAKKGQ